MEQTASGAGDPHPAGDRVRGARVKWLLQHLPYLGGALATSLGLLVLSGWLLGRYAWTTILPGLPAMVANSALMAIFAGVSLVLAAPASCAQWRSIISKVCAGVVAAIAGLTLIEHAFGLDFGIDQLLATPEEPYRHKPGRPSVQTSLGFLLMAASLLSLNRHTARGRRPAELMALLAGLFPLVALIGYLFGSAELYSPFTLYPYAGMGITSAVSLLALSTGAMAARADVGVLSVLLAQDSGGFTARRLVAWLFAFAVLMCAIEIGAGAGLYHDAIATTIVVLLAAFGGSAFVLQVARELSRFDTRRAEDRKQLRESQERFSLALRGAALAAWDWNVRSGAVVFNARWAEMRGYRPDEIRPHVDSWTTGIHAADRPKVAKALDEYFAGRTPEYESEHRVRTKDGDWIWILDRGRVFERDERGYPLRMVGTELDITARKRLEASLRLAEAKSTGILSISADAIISIDAGQRIRSFNEGAEKIFGYSSAELIGAPVETLIPERFRTAHRQHVERFAGESVAARRMGERGTKIFGLRKNGEEFPADAAISKLKLDGSTVLTVAVRDISEQQRRESEKALLAQLGPILTSDLDCEKTLPRVAELATQELADVCIMDLLRGVEVRRLSVATRDPNHAWIRDALMEHALDRARRGLVGEVLDTRQPRVARQARSDQWAPAAPADIQQRLLDAIGPAAVVTVPFTAHDNVLGAMTLVRSSRGKAFDPQEAQLAQEIATRASMAIANGQLYRLAQAAIRDRDDVMGIVAHDLRNPLGTILMYAGDIRTALGDGNGRAARSGEAIERAAKRMNRLIQDLLDVTRIEAGHLSVEHYRVNTHRLIRDAVEAQAVLASSSGLTLTADAPSNLPEIWGDRDRLLQVFENLIGNAVKFTEAGGTITVAARPQVGAVLFSVSDTGRGLEPEDVPHLFDRFWQARSSRHDGAGLGLPIVKGLVEAHAGRIWVETAPRRGSTFYFTIPTAATSRRAASVA